MRQHIDKLVVDTEIIKVEVRAIKKMLEARHREHDRLDRQVRTVEKTLWGMWLVGAVIVGGAALVGQLKGFFS